MDFRPIVLVSGTLLAALAVMMCIPAIVDFVDGHSDWEIFAICASLTLFVGVGMALTSRSDGSKLNIRQAFVMTTLSWVFLSIFASLPFHFSTVNLSYTDSLFEAMSGLNIIFGDFLVLIAKVVHLFSP